MDLRTGLLPARGHRESPKRIARARDRPHQLHQLLGQPVSRPTHLRGVRPDAGVALARCRHRLCPRPSWHAARTIAEAGSQGVGFCTTRRRSSAGFLPVSTSLPPSRPRARCGNRLNPSSQFTNSTTIHTGNGQGTPVSLSCNSTSRYQNSAILSLDQPQLLGFVSHLAPLTVMRDHSRIMRASISFGDQFIGTASAGNVITLSNTGTAELNIGGVATNLPFTQT